MHKILDLNMQEHKAPSLKTYKSPEYAQMVVSFLNQTSLHNMVLSSPSRYTIKNTKLNNTRKEARVCNACFPEVKAQGMTKPYGFMPLNRPKSRG